MVPHWVPWVSGWAWAVPLIGIVVMVLMMFVCIRMMGHMAGGACRLDPGVPPADDVEALRREVGELKDELQRLRTTR